MGDSVITPSSPQADQITTIKDPSSVDNTATFNYSTDNTFDITGFTTAIQDTIHIATPDSFPGGDTKYAPTSSPFIIKIEGSGFQNNHQIANPFLIYANIGNFIAIIPPLPTSTNLSLGNAYGYIVKSDSSIWIYIARLLVQKIWNRPSPDLQSYNGKEVSGQSKIQIESATDKYIFLSGVPQLKLYFAPNTDIIVFKSDFFLQQAFKNISITLTQSPFIITMLGSKKGNSTTPFLAPNGSTPISFVSLFGHNIESPKSKILLVKSSSNLLSSNPSALPKFVLNDDQSTSAIQSLSASQLDNLTYFGIGNFLEDLQTTAPSNIYGFNYFDADGVSIKNIGASNGLPDDNLSTIKFNIKTLPAGNYQVVVYDTKTGAYSKAPDTLTFIAGKSNGVQIHKVSPSPTTLQNPTFTITGFNFPSTQDINDGASLSILLIDNLTLNDLRTGQTTAIVPIKPEASLVINKSSPQKDVSGHGTISLDSDTQITAAFTGLNFIPTSNTNNVIYLRLEVLFPVQHPTIGQIDDAEISAPIIVQAPPTISFLTNNDSTANLSKSLVRVDQATGQVFFNNTTSNNLFVVGKNFDQNFSVSINGTAQQAELLAWKPDSSLSALRVIVDSSNMKGDLTVEVKSGSFSSEPFVLFPPIPLQVLNAKTKKGVNGLFSAGKQVIQANFFESILPYDHNSGTFALLNNKKTKVSSSIALDLSNDIIGKTISLNGKLDSTTNIDFLPFQIIIPDDTPLSSDGSLNVFFNFFGLYNIHITTPTILRLQHRNGNFANPVFNPGETMTVVGDGFVNGMRFKIGNNGWKAVDRISSIKIDGALHQSFEIVVPPPSGNNASATIEISNDQADSVSSINASGQQVGPYKVSTIVVNDKYSPLLKINQRLPAGVKVYAKGPQVAMTDVIDANMSIYSQMSPFLGSFKTLLVVIRIIVCIIDVICALINPFKLIMAIIALMDCIIDLLSLFPQLAVPVMILSFLQNFVGFLLTFITQIETYVFSIINSQLSLVKAQTSKDISLLAAAEQQSFGAVKQMRDVIAFMEPPMQIIQVFKDLLKFAMHFPCASNQGTSQDDGSCPPDNMQTLIDSSGDKEYVKAQLKNYGAPFLSGSYPSNTNESLSTMFCQAVAIQTATLQTMPGAPTPGTSSVISTISPSLPNIAAAIECMTLLTDNIENGLNSGTVFIKTPEQGEAHIAAYRQCVQSLLTQTQQAIGDVCPLAFSALNSELKAKPKGSVAKNISDDFIKTKIPLPTTQPEDIQDSGLALDLAKINVPSDVPQTITTDPVSGKIDATLNFGLTQDLNSPIIILTTNKSGQRQSIDTIYFNAENGDVGDLIVPGDILEIVGGTFGGLQFPIIAVQKIFTAIRLTTKLDITPEQKLLIGEQTIPLNLSGFDVKIIAHLAGNDDVAVVPADNQSLATIQIIARDHHGHQIGGANSGLADKISIHIDSGDAMFVPAIPSSTTDITGIIQESGDHFIANLKSDCAGIAIISASVCGLDISDIGYFANDPNHVIKTRKKTIRILFTPPIPRPVANKFEPIDRPQEPATRINN